MTYPSVDKLQNLLASEVFHYAKDSKKASGRALGTLIEIVTFYTLCAWGLRNHIAIERSVPEFAHPAITHNVEFSLHPILSAQTITLDGVRLPITPAKLARAKNAIGNEWARTNNQLLSGNSVLRNAAIIANSEGKMLTGHLESKSEDRQVVTLAELLNDPFAIVECKRVGVEEGMKKGPQTIEKAKQGAYVARAVSSLQKLRLADGTIQGVVDLGSGVLHSGPYSTMLREMIDGNRADLLRHFILTIGVVSNHGNWFTAEDHNKELRVLAQSYDWLLFLTDDGLCQFIEKLLLNPVQELEPAREAFLASYPKQHGSSQFTKVTIGAEADKALKRYFELHEPEVEGWFNVIAPNGATIANLREDLLMLTEKDWEEIRL